MGLSEPAMIHKKSDFRESDRHVAHRSSQKGSLINLGKEKRNEDLAERES